MRRYYFIFLIFIFIFFVSLFYFNKIQNENVSSEKKIAQNIETNNTKKPRTKSGYLEYLNERYKFSVLYPRNFSVKEHFFVDDTVIIVFEEIKEKKGFQIFITPYDENQITSERFKKDMPSGVQKDLKNIYVDRVLGASFYGFDDALGETKEIWFINNGFLYEVSTLKSMQSLTEDLVDTWKFIK